MGIIIAVVHGQGIVSHGARCPKFIFSIDTIIGSTVALPHQHQTDTDGGRILATSAGNTDQTRFSQSICPYIQRCGLDIGTNNLAIGLAASEQNIGYGTDTHRCSDTKTGRYLRGVENLLTLYINVSGLGATVLATYLRRIRTVAVVTVNTGTGFTGHFGGIDHRRHTGAAGANTSTKGIAANSGQTLGLDINISHIDRSGDVVIAIGGIFTNSGMGITANQIHRQTDTHANSGTQACSTGGNIGLLSCFRIDQQTVCGHSAAKESCFGVTILLGDNHRRRTTQTRS